MAQSPKASSDAETGEEPDVPAGTDDGLTVQPAAPFAAGKKKGAATGEELPEPPAPPLVAELVDEDTVRSGLELEGLVLHSFLAVDQDDEEWVWLSRELDVIAPPLTRIVNRYPLLAHMVGEYGDPAIVAGAVLSHAKRSLEERAVAIARKRHEDVDERAAGTTFEFLG